MHRRTGVTHYKREVRNAVLIPVALNPDVTLALFADVPMLTLIKLEVNIE